MGQGGARQGSAPQSWPRPWPQSALVLWEAWSGHAQGEAVSWPPSLPLRTVDFRLMTGKLSHHMSVSELQLEPDISLIISRLTSQSLIFAIKS